MAASRCRAQGASSSSSPCGYHVFLNFRGADTRKGFTNYLYRALLNAGFRTFRDENDPEKGEPLDPELKKGIQLSRSSVIVFSKNYASSTWCLDELVMILNRRRQISSFFVLPVFYDVDPTHVRKQTGSFAESFVRYNKIIEEEKDEKKKEEWRKKVEVWREALQEAADLIGDVLSNKVDGYELEFIEEIVKVLEYKVNRDVFVESQLTGIDSRVKNINLWLQNESTNYVGIMAICGISGIGKTTIARYAYDLNFCKFQGSSFLANIKQVSKQWDGLVQLQRKLLSDIQKRKVRKITSVHEGIAEIKAVLHFRKVLVVLDDVDEKDQLDAIISMHKFFHPGSKIIITTTNMRLLRSYKVKTMDVEIMSDDESLELLSWHAFGQHCPTEGYKEYSQRAVKQCGGLPLALEVLGAALRNMEENVWRSTLDRFEEIHSSEIQNKLRISYDHLPDDQYRNLFLDIACFFVGMDMGYVITILDGCGYFGPAELQTLFDRCLIKMSGNKLMMHTLIQRMGREIIRQLSPEKLGERSRLWNHVDSFKVLKEKIGTKTIRGLALNMKMLAEDMHAMEISNSNKRYDGSLETNAFRCMQELRLLQINYVRLVGGYKEFPNNIRWLCWHGFSLKSFPNDFPMENLVVIDMSNSSFKQLWKGAKCIGSLKILDLRYCDGLKKTPMFCGLSSLERLILKGCISLVEVHESIGNLQKLILLNMSDCRSLEKLPTKIGKLSSLETLNISGCSNLKELPSELKEIKSLQTFEANEIDLSLLPSTNEVNRWWHSLMWFGRSRPRTRLELVKTVLGVLPQSLVTLKLEGCNLSNDDFPKDFSSLPSLRVLNLSRNPICSLPDCVKGVDSLKTFIVHSCTNLKTLVGLPQIKDVVDPKNCPLLEKITYTSSSASTSICDYQGCVNLIEWQGQFKLEPVSKTDREIINNLGLSNIESIKSTKVFLYSPVTVMAMELPIQVLSGRGRYNIFLPGGKASGYSSNSDEASGCSCNSDKASGCSCTSTARMSVHLIQNCRIRGFNMSCVYGVKENSSLNQGIEIQVYNRRKIIFDYWPTFFGVPKPDEYIMWLSHWKLNELKDRFSEFEPGDELNFQIIMRAFEIKEFKISLVYDEHEEKNDDEHEEKNEQSNSEDMLGSASTFRDTTFVEPMNGSEVNAVEISPVCNEQERKDAQSNCEDMHGLPQKRRKYA